MIPADIGMSSPRCLACRKWSCKTGASAVSARCAKVAAGIIWFRSRSRRGNRGLFCSWNDACRRDMVLAVSDGKLILFCRRFACICLLQARVGTLVCTVEDQQFSDYDFVQPSFTREINHTISYINI